MIFYPFLYACEVFERVQVHAFSSFHVCLTDFFFLSFMNSLHVLNSNVVILQK